MLFNSIDFLIFFPIVTVLYFAIPHKYRWIFLLAASCIFYMAFIPAYVLFLFFLIFIDYWAAIFIEKSEEKKRKLFLIASILSTCSALFIFKYFNFFNVNLALVANFFHWNYPVHLLKLVLPIGLSFHTFQSLSYVIEVYRKKQKTEKNIGIYALYVMFYPQLVSGPIERPYNLIHQFYEKHYFDYKRVTDGLKLMAWGMFKKVVIADRLAIFVNQVYNTPNDYSGISLIMATIFFAYQIFCDFSGYSDIAIGSAQVMGFKLMNNFTRPYFSKSVSDFWRRWHISLSTWFRDYVYIPLGGSRVSNLRHYFNLFVSFLVSGLWHGANWTFLIWGALNGIYMILEAMTVKVREKIIWLIKLNKAPVLYKIIQVFTTFSLISFSWIFFRANSVNEAFYIIRNLFTGVPSLFLDLIRNPFAAILENHNLFVVDQSWYEFIIGVLGIILLEIVHLLQRKESVRAMISRSPLLLRWALYVGIILIILNFGKVSKPFIYFQF
ncbi:MAG: MBOAT family protein [Candidatus Nealsonbacteria bacterium]|nr:MBOAT family protein [Candidatus Nealsonbacteria bacterium]